MDTMIPGALGRPHEHAVQFYQDETFLCATVASFIADGLSAGQPAVVIATPAHRIGITAQLATLTVDVEDAVRTGDLVMLDAAGTLATFMTGDRVDSGLFRCSVGMTVERLLGRCATSMRAYGEMVDVLWKEGNAEAAIRLEILWNELAASYPFSLLCGYAIGNFYKQTHPVGLADVCRQHSQVLPAEN